MEDTCVILGRNIKDLRKRFHMTQAKLASYLGCTTNAVYKWEAGENYPSSYYLPLIAEKFYVDINYLFEKEH